MGTAVERRGNGAGLVSRRRRRVELPGRAARRAGDRHHRAGDDRELGDPDQTLRSVTTVFAAQVQAGPGGDRRDGAAARPLDVAAHDGARTPGGTSRSHDGRRVRRSAHRLRVHLMRAAGRPPPHDCQSFRDPLPPEFENHVHMNFWDYIEGKPASGHPPWEPYVPTSSERSAWYRFDEPPMLDDGRLDPLAIVTLCDTMPGAVGERMGRRDHHWLPPSCDLTVHLLGDAHRVGARGEPGRLRGRRLRLDRDGDLGRGTASTSSRTRRSRCSSCSRNGLPPPDQRAAHRVVRARCGRSLRRPTSLLRPRRTSRFTRRRTRHASPRFTLLPATGEREEEQAGWSSCAASR